jgi:hypothetical protein
MEGGSARGRSMEGRMEEGAGLGCATRRKMAWGRGAGGRQRADGQHPQPADSGGCGSMLRHAGAAEPGGACRPRVRVWASQGKEGAGPGPRATVPVFYLKRISKLNTI